MLNKVLLISEIEKASKKAREEQDPLKAEERFAKELATAIENYVKSGIVNTVVTLTSATSGSGVGNIN